VENWKRFNTLLARPVDGASLAFFRIAVGVVMMLESWSLLRPSASTNGRVMLETYYTGADVTCHFPYAWFEWLPIPAEEVFLRADCNAGRGRRVHGGGPFLSCCRRNRLFDLGIPVRN